MYTFATAYTADGEVYDTLGNFDTALTYASEGYRVIVNEPDWRSREDMQAAVDAEFAAAVDCFGSEHIKRGDDWQY